MSDTLTPRMREALTVIRNSPKGVSVSHSWETGKIFVTNRRGKRIDGRTWAALQRRGLVEPSGRRDNIGDWWVVVSDE